jgi:hypothetical protein
VPTDGAPQRALVQSRTGDRMVVVVKQPAACGARLTDPHFALNDSVLRVGFRVPAAASSAPVCVATGIFTMKDLPSGSLSVLASADDAIASTMRASPTPTLAMKFLGAESRPLAEGGAQTSVRQIRHGDQIVAVVTAPARCGTRLADPTAELEQSNLVLRYRVAVADGQQRPCAATAVFSVKGLPSRALVALAQPAPSAGSVEIAASAAAPVQSAPRMSFVAAPAIPVSGFGSERHVVQVRNGDTMNVVIHEPAACGDRPERASFKLERGRLWLRYGMRAAQTSATSCVATAMVAFRGLPADDIEVVATSDSAPDGTLAWVWPPKTRP